MYYKRKVKFKPKYFYVLSGHGSIGLMKNDYGFFSSTTNTNTTTNEHERQGDTNGQIKSNLKQKNKYVKKKIV